MPSPQTIAWYINRLSVMSWREVVYRIKEQLHLQWLYCRYLIGKKRIESLDYAKLITGRDHRMPNFNWCKISESEATQYLNGCLSLFGKPWMPHDDNKWHCCAVSGIVWPRIFFNSITYKQGASSADIRIAWEPSRLQHLIALALIVKDKPDSHALELIRKDIKHWRQCNRCFEGIHYISAMECALRLIAVVLAVDMIREYIEDNDPLWLDIASMAIEHGSFINGRLSLYSSLGNHTLAETAGLICVSLFMPQYRHSDHWRKKALTLFANEFDRQIDSSGFGIEQSSHYYKMIVDLAIFVSRMLDYHNIPIPDNLTNALIRARTELNKIKTVIGSLPSIGDSDSSYAISPYFCEALENKRSYISAPYHSNASFTAIRSEMDRPVALVFNHGALGMAPSYGHGHADALSVLLFIAGNAILLDVGTYAYSISDRHRRYFRSTQAHNTVCVKNCDQAVQKTPFMWSLPYHCESAIHHCPQQNLVIATAHHSGYQHLGLSHLRAVIVKQNKGIFVRDYLECCTDNTIELELNWHAHGKFTNKNNVGFQSVSTGLWCRFVGGQTSRYYADKQSLKGWYSERYATLNPITTFTVAHTLHQSHIFSSIFSFEEQHNDEQNWYKEINYAQEFIQKNKPHQ